MDQPATARAQMPAADQVVDALRIYAADNAEVVHQLARWLGVNAADAEAFGQVLYEQERGTPLSPSVLAHRLGLTTGATATVINRLEAAGLVSRSREHRDRRIVTLRIVPGVREQAVAFFTPLTDRVDEMMRSHPEDFLRTVVALLDDLHGAIADVVAGFATSPRRIAEAPSPTHVGEAPSPRRVGEAPSSTRVGEAPSPTRVGGTADPAPPV